MGHLRILLSADAIMDFVVSVIYSRLVGPQSCLITGQHCTILRRAGSAKALE